MFNHLSDGNDDDDDTTTDTANVTNMAVHLQDNGLSTGLMDSALPWPEFTYEMQINPQDTGGVIMAYGPSATQPATSYTPLTDGDDVILTGEAPSMFVLENSDSGLNVHYDDQEYNTGIELDIDSWSQLSMSYSYASNNLDLMVVPNGDDTATTYSVELDDNAFQPQGILTLGQNVEGWCFIIAHV